MSTPEAGSSSARSLVLVVEDDDDTRAMLASYLRMEGFDVEEAGSAEAALSLASRRAPAIVLTDVNLPGMGGEEVGRRLREAALSSGQGPVPLVAITGHDRAGLPGGGASFDEVLVKPVPPEKIVATLRRLISARAS